jgi:hypothetical protein
MGDEPFDRGDLLARLRRILQRTHGYGLEAFDRSAAAG